MPNTFEEQAAELSEWARNAHEKQDRRLLRAGESLDFGQQPEESGLATGEDSTHTLPDPRAQQEAAAWRASPITDALVKELAMLKTAARRAAELYEGTSKGLCALGRFNAYSDIEEIVALLKQRGVNA